MLGVEMIKLRTQLRACLGRLGIIPAIIAIIANEIGRAGELFSRRLDEGEILAAIGEDGRAIGIFLLGDGIHPLEQGQRTHHGFAHGKTLG